jgi:four helix bundle protein
MNADLFKKRTKAYALRVITVVESLPDTHTGRVINNQLLRCATSVGANYRAAARAKSRADFISKMGTVEEECDESLYWMELLIEADLVDVGRLEDLMAEGNEILAMVVSSIRTARANRNQ